jgi:MoxR-like ATPase
MSSFRRFRGTISYLTNDALEAAVNCALALERPLLIKGEPGTGKTLLAEAIAEARGASSSPGTSRARRARRTASTSTTPCSASTTPASATAT